MMKVLFAVSVAVLVLAAAGAAHAQSRAFETTEEARQRHSAQNYETYRRNGYRAPLGGYPDKLGDPAPRGTERPGFSSPKGNGFGSSNGSNFGMRRGSSNSQYGD